MVAVPSVASVQDAFSPDFSLHYTLDHPPPGWTHDAGYITTEVSHLRAK